MKKVGHIGFGGHILTIYESMDSPLFLAGEIGKLLDYSISNNSHMLEVVEPDEKMLKVIDAEDMPEWFDSVPTHSNARRSQTTWFVTELGLYNILSQSRKPIARGWRRIVHEELIELRKSKDLDIQKQFEIWDEKFSDLYFDEKTGRIMQSVTVPGRC
jgi:prophage antirepressor-like protein